MLLSCVSKCGRFAEPLCDLHGTPKFRGTQIKSTYGRIFNKFLTGQTGQLFHCPIRQIKFYAIK